MRFNYGLFSIIYITLLKNNFGQINYTIKMSIPIIHCISICAENFSWISNPNPNKINDT